MTRFATQFARLIAFGTFSIGNAAIAVDYVKCEAIQNANTRATADFKAEESLVWGNTLERYKEQGCGKQPSPLQPGYSTKLMLDWYDCAGNVYSNNYDKMKSETANSPSVANLAARIKKIQADYSKNGCY